MNKVILSVLSILLFNSCSKCISADKDLLDSIRIGEQKDLEIINDTVKLIYHYSDGLSDTSNLFLIPQTKHIPTFVLDPVGTFKFDEPSHWEVILNDTLKYTINNFNYEERCEGKTSLSYYYVNGFKVENQFLEVPLF